MTADLRMWCGELSVESYTDSTHPMLAESREVAVALLCAICVADSQTKILLASDYGRAGVGQEVVVHQQDGCAMAVLGDTAEIDTRAPATRGHNRVIGIADDG